MENHNQNDNNDIQPDIKIPAIRKADANAIFSGDSYGLFVYKKTERIVAGVYLITNYLSDKEPFKWGLREASGLLLSGALSLSNRVWGEDDAVDQMILSLVEISSVFDVAQVSNIISKVNYEIIRNELDKLVGFLTTSSKSISSAKIAFSQNHFDGDYNYVPEQNYQSGIFDVRQGQHNFYKGQKDIRDMSKSPVLNKMSDDKKTSADKIIKDKNNRQEIIISMLKSGVHLTIKDFTQNIKDCSEKTIQRELLFLVSKGTIKKEGERRWSKYYLA
jgi:hypothetical protein